MAEPNANPRRVALLCVGRVLREGAYSNLTLKEALRKNPMSDRDKAFCTALFYGVLQRRDQLDAVIANFSTIKFSKLSPRIHDLLRCGVYQLLYLTHVPPHAACDQSVRLARSFGNPGSVRFVNGVLRAIARDVEAGKLPARVTQEPAKLHGIPDWIYQSWCADYGSERADALCAAADERPARSAVVNTLRISRDELLKRLMQEGMQASAGRFGTDTVLLLSGGDPTTLPSYQEGLFHLCGEPSRLTASLLCVQPGMTVVDCCAAPGGKTVCLGLDMQNSGTLYAFDCYEHKLPLIQKSAQRMGLTNLSIVLRDARTPDEHLFGKAQRVLCDVPCSGLGQLSKKPEIRYKSEAEFASLPATQFAILQKSAGYLAPGGELVYSTCTLRTAENEAVVERFLTEFPQFELVDFSALLPESLLLGYNNKMLTFFPDQTGTDGFFAAKIRRRN